MEVVAEVVAAAIGSIVSCVCNYLYNSRSEEYKYSRIPKEELETLSDRKEELISQVKDVTRRLQVEEEQGKRRTSVVQNWLNKANDLISEAESIEGEAEIGNTCLSGALANCCSRRNLGKRIVKLNAKLSNLVDKAGQFSLLANMIPEMGMEMATQKLLGKTTAQKNIKRVWESLMNDEFHKIGVYGMGGVGKTTLMKTINNLLLKQQSCFEKVIWVTVSKDSSIHKLQNDIAKAVNLDLMSEKDDAIRQALLLKALQQRRSVLILDDMWEAFSIHEIGIPEPSKENKCKLVLTTRNSDVCHRMGCQKNIKVELLSDDEGWELFMHMLGGVLSKSVEEIAKEIVKECACLPLAIITTGAAMRGKVDIQDWEGSLIDLQEHTNWVMDLEVQVIERLKFSYNQLRNDVFKSCFLYCALYPDDWEIPEEELIENWIMDGLISGNSRKEEIVRGHLVLGELKNCCMLEEVTENRDQQDALKTHVKMHDLIRDMALHVARTNPHFIVKAGVRLGEVPLEDEWSVNLERVSFMDNEIEDISISPECPRLLTVFLEKNPLRSITPGFFAHMKGLTVLNLSMTEITELPDSVSDLVNLRGLLLSKCYNLIRVPSLSKMQSLRVLKLNSTPIEALPQGMEKLVNLKILNLCSAEKLSAPIPVGLISCLSSLQVLDLSGIGVEKVYAKEKGRHFVEELLSLAQLDSLLISFHNVKDYGAYVGSEKYQSLKVFNILVGRNLAHWRSQKRGVSIYGSLDGIQGVLPLPKATEFLTVGGLSSIRTLPEVTSNMRELKVCSVSHCKAMTCILPSSQPDCALLERVEKMSIKYCVELHAIYEGVSARLPCLKKLDICSCQNLKILFSSTVMQHLQNLEELRIKDCDTIEELISMDEVGTITTLPRLQRLSLVQLPKLTANWSCILMFSNYWKCVHIESCHRLKSVFSTRLLQNLNNLEDIEVHRCGKMEEIFTEDEIHEGRSNTISLPRLQKLELSWQPNLKSIWKGAMVCNSLETVEVRGCAKLKRLPQLIGEDQSPPPFLIEIKAEMRWWESLDWDHVYDKILLQPLFKWFT